MKQKWQSGFLAWLLLMFCALNAQKSTQAHDLKVSSIKVILDKASVSVSVVAHSHSFSASAAPAAEISHRLKLRLNGKPFRADKVQIVRDGANGIVIWQATQNGAAARVEVDAPLFPEKENESTVVTVLRNRQVVGEALVNAKTPSAQMGDVTQQTVSKVCFQFLREGVAHIFGGFDHVLFLISLLLLGGTGKQLLKIVTAFTLAHSITLSLAATGILVPPARFIEPLIALSIVAVAGLNLLATENKPRLDARPWLALGFGLVHGFGFAAALSETGLPREALGWALLSFNGGVEIGQGVLVVLFAPALAWIVKSRPRWREPIVFYGSASVAVVGAFWFAERVFMV